MLIRLGINSYIVNFLTRPYTMKTEIAATIQAHVLPYLLQYNIDVLYLKIEFLGVIQVRFDHSLSLQKRRLSKFLIIIWVQGCHKLILNNDWLSTFKKCGGLLKSGVVSKRMRYVAMLQAWWQDSPPQKNNVCYSLFNHSCAHSLVCFLTIKLYILTPGIFFDLLKH